MRVGGPIEIGPLRDFESGIDGVGGFECVVTLLGVVEANRILAGLDVIADEIQALSYPNTHITGTKV
jgi:hypothetical protein